MALRKQQAQDPLEPILEEVARELGNHAIPEGKAEGANAALRVTLERSVSRVIQVYWTPFAVEVPGRSIGLHVEVAEPRVHWAECYLSPRHRSWFLAFRERPDGDIELAHHAEFETPQEALGKFFGLAGWYVLTSATLTWKDVVYEIDPELPWTEHDRSLAGIWISEAAHESLKKSTIIWLRWQADGREHTMPVWYVYDNKTAKIYVLSGERQQRLPGAERMRECHVILRWKGKNARVAEIPAQVRVIDHGSEWDEVAEKVAEKRLNIPGLPEDTARRWRDECVILELTLRA